MIIYIPGKLISLLSFPGVVMHEISHRLLCDILNVPVYEVCYFKIGSKRAGHVIHKATNNILHMLLISTAPLFINSLLCIMLTFPSGATSIYLAPGYELKFFHAILYLLGLSMGANAFPSDQDINNVVLTMQQKNAYNGTLGMRIIVRFLIFMSSIWSGFLYAILISRLIPYLIFC